MTVSIFNEPHAQTAAAHAQLVALLQRTIDQVLRPLLAGDPSVALLGFPNYANVGDSAIWLGTIAYLRSLGIAPRYVCDHATYSRQRLARRIGDGVILLQGGGNLGDLWELHQPFREAVVDAFHDHPIIQLPQSICFQEQAALAGARAVFNRHPNLTLLVRDQQSLTIACNEFGARSLLCPDMAFCLGLLPRLVAASRALVWLARSDRESALTSRPPAGAGIEPVDWLTERASALRLARWLGRRGRLHAPLSRSYDWLARQRLQRGCRVLSSGRVAITDRLHGHILCVLLGIPHVLLDNSYGKVRSFYATWTRGCELVRWAESGSDAVRLAGELAGMP